MPVHAVRKRGDGLYVRCSKRLGQPKVKYGIGQFEAWISSVNLVQGQWFTR